MLNEPHRCLVIQIVQRGRKATLSTRYPTSYKYQRRNETMKIPCVHKNTTKQIERKKLESSASIPMVQTGTWWRDSWWVPVSLPLMLSAWDDVRVLLFTFPCWCWHRWRGPRGPRSCPRSAEGLPSPPDGQQQQDQQDPPTRSPSPPLLGEH